MSDVHHTEDSGELYTYEFKKIKTRKIRFSVQAAHDAVICLSPYDDNDEQNVYEIIIGGWEGHSSAIRKHKSEDVVRVDTSEILSADEFNSFWIKIGGGKIKVGKKWSIFPFMTFEDHDKIEGIKYYGYATGCGTDGYWKFPDEDDDSSSSSSSCVSSSDSEAEELNQMERRPIMYKRPARWVPADGGHLPHIPVSGGDGASGTVYVGMAKHEGGHILGMVVPEENLCYIPWGGEAIAKDQYYVLGNPGSVKLSWKAASAGKIPTGALEGGHTEDGEALYVGRVSVDGIVSCGKVQPSHECCYVPYGGLEHRHRDYEVLCVSALPCRIKV